MTKKPKTKAEKMAFERMKELTRQIISVPKSEIEARPRPKQTKGKRRR